MSTAMCPNHPDRQAAARGLCMTCYAREWRLRTGRISKPVKPRGTLPDPCPNHPNRHAVSKGLCNACYRQQLYRKSHELAPRRDPNGVCACGNVGVNTQGLCDRCYERQRQREAYANNPEYRERMKAHGRAAYHRKVEAEPEHRSALAAKAAVRAHTPEGIRYRRGYVLRKYGLTLEARDAMIASQGGRCAICPNVLDVSKPKGCHVDHDHKTGKVRGLLCSGCNLGLGHFRDDPALLRIAASYLERPRP
jgi:hypothetical protein